MNPENFLVRPHREQLDAFSDFDSWLKLTPEAHAEVVDHLAGLPTAYHDNDTSEEAKRFDLLALRLQLALINAEPGYARLQAQVKEIASALLDQLTIPAVRAQHELLDDLAGDEWWRTHSAHAGGDAPADPEPGQVDREGKAQSGLHRLRRRTRPIGGAYLRGMQIDVSFSRFKQKVRIYLRAHEHHLSVEKIRRNRQITAADLDELERIFIESGIGTEAEIDQAKADSGGLGVFLRSLTGLDRQAAAAAFSKFQEGKALTASQLSFVNELIDYLAHNGTVDIDTLYEARSRPLRRAAPRTSSVRVRSTR